MGSCASIHKNSGSSLSPSDLKLQMSSIPPNPQDSIPPTPIKEDNNNNNNNSSTSINMDNSQNPPIPNPAIVDPRILSLRNKSQASRFSSASHRSFGSSKEEAFFDSQAWLESDCDDDFYSVGGDFSSRGSTPGHSAVGSPRLTRVFSPQVNRTPLEGRPPLRNGSNLSRGSTPAHHRNSSSPQINGTYSEVVPGANPDATPTTKKKKKLADLFRESIRERAGEFLAFEYQGEENQANPKKDAGPNSPASVLPPKSGNRTPYVSGSVSQTSSGKITPADDYFAEGEKPIKSAQCCFPRLVSIRSYRENRKASNPPTPSPDLTA